MMAHEISTPVQIHGNENSPSFQNTLKKPSRSNKANQNAGRGDEIRLLPSGAPVDFGHGSAKNKTSSPKKLKEPIRLSSLPSLPNGEKPQFHNEKSDSRRRKESEQPPPNKSLTKSKKSQRDKPVVDISLPNGEKPNFNNNPRSKKSGNKKEKEPVAVVLKEDSSTYAGSSFHSSPAALNLPKPKFKPSPKQTVSKDETDSISLKRVESTSSPFSTSVAASPTDIPVAQSPPIQTTTVSGPAQVYSNQSSQPIHSSPFAPQQQPVYAAQAGQPAFSHFVPQPVPPPPLPPNQLYHPYIGHVPQMHYPQPLHAQPTQQGQKITFNQLLSSSK